MLFGHAGQFAVSVTPVPPPTPLPPADVLDPGCVAPPAAVLPELPVDIERPPVPLVPPWLLGVLIVPAPPELALPPELTELPVLLPVFPGVSELPHPRRLPKLAIPKNSRTSIVIPTGVRKQPNGAA